MSGRSVPFVVAVGILCHVSVPLLVAERATAQPQPNTVVVIDGRGFGHGLGMSQDGAFWMARNGWKLDRILKFFYPGTKLATTAGTVRVPIGSSGLGLLTFPGGGNIGELAVRRGERVRLVTRSGGVTASIVEGPDPEAVSLDRAKRISSVRLADAVEEQTIASSTIASSTISPTTPLVGIEDPVSGALVEAEGDPGLSAPAPTPQSEPDVQETVGSTVPPPDSPDAGLGEPSSTIDSGPGVAEETQRVPVIVANPASGSVITLGDGRRFRGSLEISPGSVINEIDVEQYLRGMGEIRSPDWPAATLQAQAIAARTYALRTMATTGQVCPTQRCQVYLGAHAEYAAMDEAVEATQGRVLTYNGTLASTFYSASDGGVTASPQEAFGPDAPDIPYLAVAAHVTGDVKPWQVRVSLLELGQRLGYKGHISGVHISRVGPSGRALEVTMTGDAGPHSVAGVTFDRLLGLRSTLFTVRFELSELPVPTLPSITATAVDQQQSDLLSPEPSAGSGDARSDRDRDASIGAQTTIGSGIVDVIESIARRDTGVRTQPRSTVAQTNDRDAADYVLVVIVVALFGTAGVILRSPHRRNGGRKGTRRP